MEVIVAKTAGFCFGVKRAVDMVYREAEEKDAKVYTLGPIIHNEEVVKDLENKGIKVLETTEDIENAEPGIVLVRAHGIEKDMYDVIRNNGHKVVDATCPFVLKIHRIVNEATLKGQFVVIVGDKNHPEVQGIKSCAGPDSIVIADAKEAAEFMENEGKQHKNLCIVSQTTYNYNKFKELVEIFTKNSYHIVDVLNTICNATEERQSEAAKLASSVDAMIVVGGKNSSNTQKLYEICSQLCDRTFYIQTADDMDYSLLRGMDKVGITAGASTPNIIIEEVQTRCQI